LYDAATSEQSYKFSQIQKCNLCPGTKIKLKTHWTKKAILLVDSKFGIQTVASNKQATTQTVKEARRTIKLLNRQGKTVAFQWVPSHVGIHVNETADLLAKKGNTLQNKHTNTT